MKLVALMPMKANSERVPGKNFKVLGTKPLFEHMLGTLVALDAIDKVIINTDAPDMFLEYELVRHEKVLVRERPVEIVGNYVSMNEVIADDIRNVDADTYIMTHATNPFLSGDTIKQCLKKYYEGTCSGEHDSLFTASKIQARLYWDDGRAVNHDPDVLLPTQHLVPFFEENSLLYIFSAGSFRSMNARVGKRPLIFETERLESIDIDTPEDWSLAAAVARGLSEE